MKREILVLLLLIAQVQAITISPDVNLIGVNTYSIKDINVTNKDNIYLIDNSVQINDKIINITSPQQSHIDILELQDDTIEFDITPSIETNHTFQLYSFLDDERYKLFTDGIYITRVYSTPTGYLYYEGDDIDSKTNYLFHSGEYIKTLTYGCSGVYLSDESVSPLTSYAVVAYSNQNNTFNCQLPLLNNTITNKLGRLCPWWSENHNRWNYTAHGYVMDYTIATKELYNNGTYTQTVCDLTGYIYTNNPEVDRFDLNFTRIPPFGNVKMAETTNSLQILYRLPEVDYGKDIDI
jgi:hypothetical protein